MGTMHFRRSTALLLTGALALAGLTAMAQPGDALSRSAARTLSEEGDRLWDQGDWAGALDRFARAHALVGAPSLAFRQAECLERLGRLVEASERYLEISRATLPADAPDVFQQAVTDAGPKAQELRARLPMLEVVIVGSPPPDTTLTVDGKPVPRELWGVKWPVDPGERAVALVAGVERSELRVTLGERETKRIELKAPAGATAPPPPGSSTTTVSPPSTSAPVAPAAAAPSATPPPAEATTSSVQAPVGWAVAGVGAAAMVLGAITGGLAMGDRSSLDESCVDGRCPPGLSDDVDSYNTMRIVSAVGLWGGLGLAAAGVIVVLTAPSNDGSGPEQAQLTPWVGMGSAGLRGTF